MLLLLLILLCGCSRRFARLRRSGDARVQVSMPSRRRTLEPVLCTRQDTFSLHRLLFTGERFRRLQRQDMARYDRYLHSIVDSADYFRCFADVAGFESYLHKAAVRRQALLEEKARLDAAAGNTVSGRSRLSDRRVYRRGLRDLRRQAARERRSRARGGAAAASTSRAAGTSKEDFERAKRTAKKMWKGRKTTAYLKCPNCGQMLSVPKGKGKIRVTCPKCHAKMETRS